MQFPSQCLPGALCRSAPEVLTGQPCGIAADIYSFGITLWWVPVDLLFCVCVCVGGAQAGGRRPGWGVGAGRGTMRRWGQGR